MYYFTVLLIKGEVKGRSELQRREQCVTEAAQILSENDSLLSLIRECLHNTSQSRPSAGEIVRRITAEGKIVAAMSSLVSRHSMGREECLVHTVHTCM